MTDIHTHTSFSSDGIDDIDTMIKSAMSKNIKIYGISEHFNYDCDFINFQAGNCDPDKYFNKAKLLQKQYADKIEILIGIECGFHGDKSVDERYKQIIEKYKPEFVVNSVHVTAFATGKYADFQTGFRYGKDKVKIYNHYLDKVYESIFCGYDYDIIAHLGYATRYAPYKDSSLKYEDFSKKIDNILTAIIDKNKILEINTNVNLPFAQMSPTPDIIKRYFDLGGRNISYASDAHLSSRIAEKRDLVITTIKNIGFEYIIIPKNKEYKKLKI